MPPSDKKPSESGLHTERFHWMQPQPRVVQHNKRRYALRLERVFWQQLESLARRKGKKLGEMVAELAEGHEGVNLSSYIRGYCMVEAEREITRYRLGAGAFDLLDVMHSSPAPAMLLDSNRTVLDMNRPIVDWISPQVMDEIGSLKQRKFDDILLRALPVRWIEQWI